MGRVIALASGKGGVGKSFLTACLANALAKTGKKVLLVDASISSRCLDLLYGVDGQILFDLGDALHGRCRPSQTVQPLNDSLALIAAPLREEPFAWQDMHRLFHLCAQDYDYVLVDCLSGAGESQLSAVRSADAVYVVVTPDRVCSRASASLAAILAQFGDIERGMLINCFQPTSQKEGHSVDCLIDAVQLPCIGVVPQDHGFYRAAVSGTLPGCGPAVQACERIAARLDGRQIPLPKGRKLFS